MWRLPSDTRGTLSDPDGIDVRALIAHKAQGGSVIDFPKGRKLAVEAVVDVACDIWIPAARPDVVREDNAGRVRAKLMLQGANIPCTPGAENMLHERGVLVVPDFIANAGGVICTAMEYRGATESAAFDTIAEKIRANTEAVLSEAKAKNMLPRQVAVELAMRRVREAMAYRRFGIM